MNIGSLEVLLGVNTAGLSRAATNMRRFESQVLGSNAAMQSSFRNLGSQMMLTGTLMTQYLTVPLTLLAGTSVKTFAAFETVMGKIAALTSFTGQEVQKMSDQLLNLTSKVGRSPKELGEGLYFIGSSGIKDTALAMDILNKSANASRIGLGDTKVVADALTSVINAYGKEMITAGQATDILVAAVREGKGEADALTRVIGHVLPLAVQLGVGFDEVAGSLASLTLTGKSASEASTQLARLFTTLIQAPPRSEDALEKLGISFKKLRKDLKEGGMLQMLETLKTMIGGNTLDVIENSEAYEKNVTVLGDVFTNIRALLPILDMMGPNFENLKRVLDSTKNSANALGNGIKDVSGTVGDKWNRTMGSLQASLIKFGDVLKGPVMSLISKFASFVNELANSFSKLPESQQKTIILFTTISAVAGPLSIVFGQLVSFATSFIAILTGTSLLSVVTQFLLLAAAIYYTWKNWDMLVQAIKDFSWESFMQGMSESIYKLISANPEKVQKQWEAYAKSLEDAGRMTSTLPKDLGFGTIEDMQKSIIEKQKEYNSLIAQMSKASSSEELYKAYGKIAPILEEIYKRQVAIIEADRQVHTAKYFDPKELKKLEELKTNAEEAKTKLWLVASDIVKAFEKSEKGLVSFGDLGKKIMSDIGEDAKNMATIVMKAITGIDITNLSKGIGVSTLPDRSGEVVQKMLRRDQLPVQPIGLRGVGNAGINLTEVYDSIIPKTERFGRIFDMTFLAVNDELLANAKNAELLGSKYDKTAKDVEVLQNALDQLTAPEMVALMTPEQLNTVRQYLELMDQMKQKTVDNIKVVDAWRSLFRDLSTLAQQIGKYMGEGFQQAFQVISDVIGGVGTVIRIIKDVLQLTKLTTAAETAKTAVTAAGIPVTLSAAAAETTKAAASTEAAIAGAASSTSWIPFVGVALAIGGIALLLNSLTSAKKKATGMATGGMVPAGFPNDSFPAMLTSGETVIPLNKLGKFTGNGQEINVTVEGVTRGTDIHYIVKEVERRMRNSN
jgi:TP901 family phage tail tape measure protein